MLIFFWIGLILLNVIDDPRLVHSRPLPTDVEHGMAKVSTADSFTSTNYLDYPEKRMTYPLLFPNGDSGWHPNILYRTIERSRKIWRRRTRLWWITERKGTMCCKCSKWRWRPIRHGRNHGWSRRSKRKQKKR